MQDFDKVFKDWKGLDPFGHKKVQFMQWKNPPKHSHPVHSYVKMPKAFTLFTCFTAFVHNMFGKMVPKF